MGYFLGFYVYIFDITKLFLFQMFGWGVLGRVVGVAFGSIGSKAMQVYRKESWL